MLNILAKTLVLAHVILSLAGMTWAIMLFVQARDLGWIEPAIQQLEFNPDGTPSTKPGAVIRFASDYDKSVVAVQEAAKARDRAYRYVKPALDSIAATEKFLPQNHLFYRKELDRLLNGDEDKKPEFKVFRFKDDGHKLTGDERDLGIGRPEEGDEVAMIKKPYKEYEADLRAIFKEIDGYEAKIREIADKTQQITADLTGTNKLGQYVNPGLYSLNALEFKYQTQFKTEIDEIKPFWSKAIEQAGAHRDRRIGLEATLKKLQAPPPKVEKKL